jgi:hypothetical protein
MVKAAILFLVVMVLIGIIGNALFPGAIGRGVKKRLTGGKPSTCPRCGRYVIGSKGCDCRKG